MTESEKEAVAVINKYGYEAIDYGFTAHNPVICRALQHVGELRHKHDRWAQDRSRAWFEWEGLEVVKGVTGAK